MRGEKYNFGDGRLLSVYQRPAKGGRSAYWIGMYYDETGHRREVYLGAEDPRGSASRILPKGNGKPHTLRLSAYVWDDLLAIAERTDEYIGEIVPRLARQERERLRQGKL